MFKRIISHYYLEVAVFLAVITLAIGSYVAFVSSTEISAKAHIIDSKSCYTKNSIFRAEKRKCTAYKVKFSYDNIEYVVWSKITGLKNPRPTYDRVYFSTIRPKATASLRPISERGKGLIIIALATLVLSGFSLYKRFPRVQ